MVEGPVTLITGAGRGIGLAVAERLAGAGRRVVGLSRHAPSDFPGEAYVEADLGAAGAAEAALADIVARYEVTALVNNAGLTGVQPLGEIDLEDYRRQIDVNLRAAMLTAQAVLPSMKRAGHGRIVNVSSRAVQGKWGRTAYAGSKAALIGMSRSWALELAEAGITVNCVAPGPVDTDMLAPAPEKPEETPAAIAARIPMRRVGTPGEVAAAIAFFLSDEASFVTGQVLYVCGGLSLTKALV